jgi:serine/threonine protein phosphatase 1
MIYILSDIHGNKQAWDEMKTLFTANDTIYVLGDVIDRGPAPIEILQEIMHMDNCHMICGNHESFMMDVLNIKSEAALGYCSSEDLSLWFHNGGEVTFEQFLNLPIKEQREIKSYLAALPFEYNIKVNDTNLVLCHAAPISYYDRFDHDKQTAAEFALWDRDALIAVAEGKKSVPENTIVISGHTPTFNLIGTSECFYTPQWINIDCGAAYPQYGGKLSVIKINPENDSMDVAYSTNEIKLRRSI